MEISGSSTGAAKARLETEASMALLDKTLDTARSGAARLLDALPAANPSKGQLFDTYG